MIENDGDLLQNHQKKMKGTDDITTNWIVFPTRV